MGSIGSPVLLSEHYTNPLPVSASSLWSAFSACSTKNADAIAMTIMHQPSSHLSSLRSPNSNPYFTFDTCLRWTYADLHHAAVLLASGFHARGVPRGATLVTLIANRAECLLMLWVAAALQLTFAPLDCRLLDPGREAQLQDYMARLEPAVVVVPDDAGGKAVDAALKATGLEAGLKVSLAASEMEGWEELEGVAGAEPDVDGPELAQDPALEQDGNRVAISLFTSGTSTGRPKGVPTTVRNIFARNAGCFGFVDVPKRALVQTPNSGVIVQAFFYYYSQNGGETIMPAPSFSPAGALDAIERYGAASMACIPIMYRMFERELAAKKRDTSALQHVMIAGDVVTNDVEEKFNSLFPSAQVMIAHGMTEGISIIGWRGYGIPAKFPLYHNIMPLGYCIEGAKLRICDEQGKVVPRGQGGELHLGGPTIIQRYAEDAHPETFYQDDQGSWLRTGDRGLMSEDGVIWILARIKDIIKKMGQSLAPSVAESVLNAMPGVEASVLSIPHAEYGEAPVAIVKDIACPEDVEHIKNVVRTSLGDDYALEDVRLLADLGFTTWPLNPTGKVVKWELRNAYLAQFGSLA